MWHPRSAARFNKLVPNFVTVGNVAIEKKAGRLNSRPAAILKNGGI
jgi:hypothetical protein